jgi:hypothetical protein
VEKQEAGQAAATLIDVDSLSDEELRAIFEAFDADKDGVISSRDWEFVFQNPQFKQFFNQGAQVIAWLIYPRAHDHQFILSPVISVILFGMLNAGEDRTYCGRFKQACCWSSWRMTSLILSTSVNF